MPSLVWKAPEYEHYERSADWFWSVGIIALALVIVASIFGNALFATFVIVGTLALLLQTIKKPKIVTFKIDERGVTIGRSFHAYTHLESFWVATDEPLLLLKSTKVLMPLLSVPLHNTNSTDVREYLLAYLREEELYEPASQKIMELLGF